MKNILFVMAVAAMLMALLTVRIASPAHVQVTKPRSILAAQIGPVGLSLTIVS